MKQLYSRRDFLRITTQAGLSLSTLSLLACNRIPGAIAVNKVATAAQAALPAGDYKALVCVFLLGGNDSYNLLIPSTPEKYDLYSKSRQSLAIPRNQLLLLNGTAADGAAYGLHPSCPELRDLFNGGSAAAIANVGTLAYPATRGDYNAGRVPPHLFSHNDQTDQWQTANQEFSDRSGWAGRIADVFAGANGASPLPMNISLAGSDLLQTGHGRYAFDLSAGGAVALDTLDAAGSTAALRAAFDRIRRQPAEQVLERGYADNLNRGIDLNDALTAALKSAPVMKTTFPANNDLARQLQTVAKLISVRDALSVRRQIFFVTMGGFDTHTAQDGSQPGLLQQVSQALSAFHSATKELGVADRVTAFTASDFGRTLTVNANGTDHGWSGHQLVVGGAVRGGRIYGMPPSLVTESNDDSEGGRFIPSTSVDEYAATLTQWFGVGGSDLDYVFPNLGRFATRGLDFI